MGARPWRQVAVRVGRRHPVRRRARCGVGSGRRVGQDRHHTCESRRSHRQCWYRQIQRAALGAPSRVGSAIGRPRRDSRGRDRARGLRRRQARGRQRHGGGTVAEPPRGHCSAGGSISVCNPARRPIHARRCEDATSTPARGCASLRRNWRSDEGSGVLHERYVMGSVPDSVKHPSFWASVAAERTTTQGHCPQSGLSPPATVGRDGQFAARSPSGHRFVAHFRWRAAYWLGRGRTLPASSGRWQRTALQSLACRLEPSWRL